MTGSEFLAGVFPYVAFALFLLGTLWRFLRWLFLPAHVKWTLYPVPAGIPEQLRYMAKEIFTFETLYNFNRPLWIGTFSLHMAMGGAVLFFILYLIGWAPGFPAVIFLGLMVIASAYIVGRRLGDRNLMALSTFEEFFNLFFLGTVAAAAFWAALSANVISMRTYFLSLIALRPEVASLPGIHLLFLFLGGLFLIYLPWSKMVHYISKYFTYHMINWQKH